MSIDALAYIAKKYSLNYERQSPFVIANMDREELAVLFCELGYKVGVEIGVQKGIYSEVLCKNNPNLLLYSVDPWLAYKGYYEFVTQRHLDEFYAEAQERLKPYNCRLVRKTSMDAVNDFENNSLDFVYIDGNHGLPWVIDDICAWDRKVRRGGIVSGHDYYESKRKKTFMHVRYAVECVVRSWRIHPWFIVGSKEILPEQKRDPKRSWFWVKT